MASHERSFAGIVLFMLANLPLGCAPGSCEDAEKEYLGYLRNCGIDFTLDNSDNNVCDDIHRQLYECYSSCLKGASCEAVKRGEPATEEAMELFACQVYCDDFFESSLRRAEEQQ